MVRISTLITAAAAAFNFVEAIPTNYFGLAGLEGGSRGELSKRAVVVSSIVDGTRAATGAVPLRLDFNEFIKDETRLNLYLLALTRMMAKSQDDPTSHYQIAGIHGRPYIAWDGVTGGNNNGGYCTHADILFLSWHRPYLALYESLLHAEVQKIAKEFPAGSAESTRHLASAATWRMPYWDWATNNATIPALIGNTPRVTVLDPKKGSTQIDNPLYSYKYHFSSPQKQQQELPSAQFATARQTTRLDINTLNGQLRNIGNNLRDRVYILLTTYENYAAFSNKGTTTAVNGKLDSLEAVHDVIHATVGGGSGEMGWVDYAAHDPLFFLHHTNIDRLFAIWQAVHEKSANAYLKPGDKFTSTYGTFAIARNSQINSNSPLPPFRKAEGNNYYSSEDVKTTKAFGYAYPETVDWDKPAGNYVAWVIGQVNSKYGAGAPAGVLTSLTSATKSMSSTTTRRSSTTTRRVTTTSRTTTRPTTTPARPTTTAARVTTTSARPTTTSVRPTTRRTTSAAPPPPPPTTRAVTTPRAPTTTPRAPTTTSSRPVVSAPPQTGNQPPRGPRTCANTPWYMWFWTGLWDCFRDARFHHNQKRLELSDIPHQVTNYVEEAIDTVGEIVSDAIDSIPKVADLIEHAASLVNADGNYNEYVLNVEADNSALDGTYTVYVFIGDYDGNDAKSWPTSPNLVGAHSAFTNIGGGHHFSGSGSIPLTAAIINLVANEKVANLGRDAVIPYLKEYLRWEVATANGEAVPSKDVKDLKVSVVSSGVKLPCVEGALPLWSEGRTEYSITEGKDGGVCEKSATA